MAGQNGQDRYTTEIEASEMKMLDRAPAMGNQRSTPEQKSKEDRDPWLDDPNTKPGDPDDPPFDILFSPQNTTARTTAYYLTCGSGSLLLKVAAEAGKHITLKGQEKDVTTAGLALMNMILHDFPTANILTGNILAAPKFLDVARRAGGSK